jgi:hypothetical protein
MSTSFFFFEFFKVEFCGGIHFTGKNLVISIMFFPTNRIACQQKQLFLIPSHYRHQLRKTYFPSGITSLKVGVKLPRKLPIAFLLITVVTLPVFFLSPAIGGSNPADNGIFFGVTFGGNTTREAKDLVDKVKGFTNLFIVANWDVDLNETLLNEICQLAVDANMYIMV